MDLLQWPMALALGGGPELLFSKIAGVSTHPAFGCTHCTRTYDDGPPLVTITGGTLADERYCSDECAYDAGWSRAVVARWKAEAENGTRFITYLRPDYIARMVS